MTVLSPGSGRPLPDVEVVIGLEVHVQLALRSKLFSPAEAGSGGIPNTRVHPVDLGLPGQLPVLNSKAVELAVRAALALQMHVHPISRFDRKHYDYPDLPKGYQITQTLEPLATGGAVPMDEGPAWPLQRLHLEEDAGKLIHHEDVSALDLNRAGIALIEIVSEPRVATPALAHSFLKRLRQILHWAEVSDGNMEKGELRCDANISLCPKATASVGNRVELKNLNSFRMVERALAYEITRQTGVLGAGNTVAMETRGFDDRTGQTHHLRSKETQAGYRTLHEPDLPALVLTATQLAAIQASMPPSLESRKDLLRREAGLSTTGIEELCADRRIFQWYERLARASGQSVDACHWTRNEVLSAVRACGGFERFKMEPETLAPLLSMIADGKVGRQAARQVYAHMLAAGVDAITALEQTGLQAHEQPQVLSGIIAQVLDQQPDAVAAVRQGTMKALHALKGAVLRQAGGRADPHLVDRMLREALDLR